MTISKTRPAGAQPASFMDMLPSAAVQAMHGDASAPQAAQAPAAAKAIDPAAPVTPRRPADTGFDCGMDVIAKRD